MRIINLRETPEKQVWETVIKVLAQGGMVVFPTETCYGLGVDATNQTAVEKLLNYKGNRGNKAVSIAVCDPVMAERYVAVNELAQHLYEQFLPGPMTVVSKSLGKVVPALESDRKTLGIRIPGYPPVVRLIKTFGKPMTSTSANTSGRKPPYSLKDWQTYTSLKKQAVVDVFIDAGELPERQPSTVVDTTLNEPTVLRQGELVIPHTASVFGSDSVAQTQQIGGQLMSAYMKQLPNAPIIFALQGELGAGKTQLVKGVAKALGIQNNVNSPTYLLMKEYPIKTGKLYHIDTWRMESADDLTEIGFKEMLTPGNVVAIEWLQKVKPMLDQLTNFVKLVWIDLKTTGKNTRHISVFERQRE